MQHSFKVLILEYKFNKDIVLFLVLKIRKTNRRRQSLTQSHCTELSIARMLLCVVFVFGICYLPTLYVSFLFANVNSDFAFTYNVLLLAFLTTSVNSAVNFIIYCLMSQKFRETLVGLRRNPTRSNGSVVRSLSRSAY